MKGGRLGRSKKRREAEAEAEEKRREAEEKRREAALSQNKINQHPSNFSTYKKELELKNIMDADNIIIKNNTNEPLINAIVDMINSDVGTTNNGSNLKKHIMELMNILNKNKVDSEKYTMHDMYQVIFSNGGKFDDMNSIVNNIFPILESSVTKQNIVDALHKDLKDVVSRETGIEPSLGPKPPPLKRDPPIEQPPTGGKRRTRRRSQRSNKKRTNKRKKTKTRMKKRKTSKRKTNKRRRKR